MIDAKLNQDCFSIEDIKQFFTECGADPDEFDLEGFRNLHNVIATLTNNKLSKDDSLDGYSILRNTMMGNEPSINRAISEENIRRALVRYMENIEQTRGKLEQLEKQKLAFCVYYSTYHGLEKFEKVEQIEELFQEDLKENKKLYTVSKHYLIPDEDYGSIERNDLALLGNAIIKSDLRDLIPRLADNCMYISERANLELCGINQIKTHFDKIREKSSNIYFCFLADLIGADDGAEFADRTDCLAMAFVDEENIISLAFLDYDENGHINRIKQADSTPYRFRYRYHLTPVSSDYFYEQTMEYNEKYDFGFDDFRCRCFSNFFAALDEFSNHEMTYDEIVDVWLFIEDIINDREPNFHISADDAYRDIVITLMRYSSTKNIPFESMKLFAFSLYYLFFIRKEGANGKMVTCLDEFYDTDHIRKEYEHELTFKNELIIEPLKSDETADDFGLVLDNPVEVISIETEYLYLNCLSFEDGTPIDIGAHSSMGSERYNRIVDKFEILKNGEHVTDIYMYGYAIKGSFKAPKGFIFNG